MGKYSGVEVISSMIVKGRLRGTQENTNTCCGPY
jgi:hypothetical protein